MSIVEKSRVGALLIVMVIATACGATAVTSRQPRPAYAVRQQTLYSFASESSSVVVRAWNPVAKRFEHSSRFVNIIGSPIAATALGADRFVLLTGVRRGHYAIYVLTDAEGSSPLGRLLWRGDSSGELFEVIPDREGFVVVGRQKVYYLEKDRLKYLGPGPQNVYRQFSSVAVDGKGRIAINEDFGLAEYDITNGQLVERCRLQEAQLSVKAIGPGQDGWIVLGTREATKPQIFSVRKCEASPSSDPLEPGQSWLTGSTKNTSVIVINTPGQSQSVAFIASERGLQRVQLPLVPDGLLYVSDGPQPVLFSVSASGVSSYPLVDQ